jgi:hypothetical protein
MPHSFAAAPDIEDEAIDHKAIRILMSARAVAEEIDDLRRRAVHQGGAAGRDLEDAVSRLCNLISLALVQLEASVGEMVRDRVQALLAEVRGRWQAHNVDRIATRLAAIDAEIARAKASRVCRLGLADRLGQACAEIVEVLRAMGAEDLPGLEGARIRAILDEIDALAATEAQRFRIIDFDHPRR